MTPPLFPAPEDAAAPFHHLKGLPPRITENPRPLTQEVVETDWAGLRALNAPAAATRRFQLMVDHWVLIESTTETHAVVLDPLAGRQTLPRAELEALWRGVLVVVRRPA